MIDIKIISRIIVVFGTVNIIPMVTIINWYLHVILGIGNSIIKIKIY